MKNLPAFVLLVSLAFAVDCLAQTPPAQGPIQIAQAAGGASPGAVPAGTGGSVAGTTFAAIAIGAAAIVAVSTSNSTTSSH